MCGGLSGTETPRGMEPRPLFKICYGAESAPSDGHRNCARKTSPVIGAVYKASGWIRVGTTQGRGRYDGYNQYDKPRKDISLRPLRKAGGEQTRPCPPHLVRGFDTRCPLGV